jgi:hypothetical protein
MLFSVMAPAFSCRFSEAGRGILAQPPLLQSGLGLLHARSGAQYASALVQTGLAAHDTLKTIAEAMQHTDGRFIGDTALELGARFFDFGNFGISHTSTHQTSVLRYGIPCIDDVGGDLFYTATETASFTGHQANANNIVIIAGKEIIVLPEAEETVETTSQSTSSANFNIITGDARLGYGSMHSDSASVVHRPTIFVSRGTNTFRAPHMSFTNPLLQATENRFSGETEFALLYDSTRTRSSFHNVGLSFSHSSGYTR